MRCARILPAGVLISLIPALAAGQAPDSSRVRDALTRGYAAIQKAQRTSRTSQSCATTCHLQVYGAFAYRAVREHHIALDEDVARADLRRAFRSSGLSAAIEDNALGEVGINEPFFLVAAHEIGLRPSVVSAAVARAVALQQNSAGDWSAFHDRPPSSHSSFTFTALGLRALQLYGHSRLKEDTAARVARAKAWLQSHDAPETEDKSYQLLGLWWAGADPSLLRPLAKALADRQQSDGGWSSRAGRDSDAYSTGEALVALHDAGGMATDELVWRRGIEFLIRTQATDGTWHVRTRLPPWVNPPYFESGYPYGRDQFISVAGANWSLRALALALPNPTVPDRLPLADVTAADVEPWVESAMFGTPAELKRLLDDGLSVNAFTAAGRTSLLMMVVPDGEKVRLLVERRVDVNARSARNYSALLVAAQYRSSSDVIRLLLSRGADVRADHGKAAADAFPTFFASRAGNAEIIPALHRAGDALESTTIMFGTFPVEPLTIASAYGDTDVMRTLIDLGTKVDPEKAKRDGALAVAVQGHQIEAARLLIARGADVNRPGEKGRTPLMHAAVADFGDLTLLDLLLKSGARTDVRDEGGLTAADYARTYHHEELIARLK